MKKNKLIIAVDFDNTICDSKFPVIFGIKKGAKRFVRKLKDDGHELILWTCRCNGTLKSAIEWLNQNDLDVFDAYNENTESWKKIFPDLADDDVGPKIYADVYIDDKNIGTKNISWKKIYKQIKKKSKMENCYGNK